MKALATILIAAVLPTTSSSAQITLNVPAQQQTSAFGVDPIIRVTTIFRTALETAPHVGPGGIITQDVPELRRRRQPIERYMRWPKASAQLYPKFLRLNADLVLSR
jgi:hypothetical protein